MNAAAKVMHQTNIFNGHLLGIHCSMELKCVLTLLFAILLSALAIVYVTNQHRLYFSQLQQQKKQHQILQIHRGQLLLEQASLTTPARVERFASKRLQMYAPSEHERSILYTT